MRRAVAVTVLCSGFVLGVQAQSAAAPITILSHPTSEGYYNDDIGQTLNGSTGIPANGTDPLFLPIAPEPDLTAAAAILGDWLDASPLPLNANWSGLQAIPSGWPVFTETAIIYPFTLNAPSQLTGFFGVDNGIYVWLDGDYKFGARAPGGVGVFEYSDIDFGVASAGTHYLQILREDSGGAQGFAMQVDAEQERQVPEPSTLLLFGGGVLAAVRARRTRNRRS